MLRINNATSKQTLFAMLEEAVKDVGDLEINVDSLPAFMSTQIALNIFSYQIDKYPRKIVWRCEDKDTAELLQSGGFYVTRKTKIQPVVQDESNPDKSQTITNEIKTPIEAVSEKPIPQAETVETPPEKVELPTPHLTKTKKTINSTDSNPLILSITPRQPQIAQPKNIQEQATEQNFATSNEGNENSNLSGFNQWQQWFKPRDRLSALNLTQKHTYTPSALLNDKTDTDSADQDLDQWLSKIHNTKTAVNQKREQQYPEGVIAKTLFSKNSKKFSKPRNRSLAKGLQLLTGAVLTSCLFVLFLITFPTNVYTVEIEPPTIEDSAEVEFAVSEFAKKTVNPTVKSTIEATGRKEVETVNATGKAILINSSGNNINLTNGGFYLLYQGQKYKHEYDSSRSQTITIPSRNNLNGPKVEINVRAVASGPEANLPEDTRFSVINLKEQNVGNALFALATTPIQNKELSGEKVVTQSDLDLLASTNEGKTAQEIGKEISAIQNQETFTSSDWYQSSDPTQEYDAKVGEVKPKVSLTTTIETSLYYLPQATIANKLKLKNENIDEVVEVVIKSEEGKFDQSDNLIRLDMFYSYHEKTSIDKTAVSKTLTNEEDFTKAEQKLKQQYPYIKTIEKKESGLTMPMVKPKVDINILESE